jgi:hypothetical protein
MFVFRAIAAALAALAVAAAPAQAQSHRGGFHQGSGAHPGGWQGHGIRGGNFQGHGGGFHHGGHPGRFVGSVAIGFGFVDGFYYPAYYPAYAYYPGYVVYPQTLAPGAAAPIFYARNGQNEGQIAADFGECNQWAYAQPNASADADVFYRAMLACMDARGYSGR